MPLVGIGVGLGMAGAGAVQAYYARKTAKENLAYQLKRDEQLSEDQDRRARDDIKSKFELQKLSAEAQELINAQNAALNFGYQKDLINYHRDKSNYPLREPLSTLDTRSLYEALRIFLVPPEDFSIRCDGNSSAWNNVHTHTFTESIRAFFQTHYAEDSSRPVKLYEPSILNHGGYRSSNAVDLLQQSFTTHPTMWIESNRMGNGCSLGMSQWGGGLESASFRTLGAFPNYDIALGEQNKMGLFLLGQKQSEIEASVHEMEHCYPHLDDEAAELMRAGVANLVEQYQSIDSPLAQEKIDDKAALFLADAYKVLIAAAADMYFLNKGVVPLLPQLINNGHIAMDSKFIQGATSQLMSEYITTSAQMASEMPEVASTIWVGIGEAFIGISNMDAAKHAVEEAIKAEVSLLNISSPETDQEFIDSAKNISGDVRARLHSLCEETNQRKLAAALEGVGVENKEHVSSRRPNNMGASSYPPIPATASRDMDKMLGIDMQK